MRNHSPIAMCADKTCWVLSDGTIGMEKQSLALAEGVGLPAILKRVSVRQPWSSLPARLWCAPFYAVGKGSDSLKAPYPDLLISAGGRVVGLTAAIRQWSGGRSCAVQIQNPRYRLSAFDLIIAPRHDGLSGPNVLETDGSLHAVTPVALRAARAKFAALVTGMPALIVTVLLGGNSRRHRFTTAAAERLGKSLARLAADGTGLLITPSRRTPQSAIEAIRGQLAETTHHFWNGQGENPYIGMLALADALIVTNDSVNMLSEAAATGKPVHVFELAGGSARFDRFLNHMQALGITRPFEGKLESWSYRLPEDNERAVAAVRNLLDRRG